MDEDTIRFKAPVITSPATRRYDLDEQEARVERLVLGYQGREVDRNGGATLLGVGFDFNAGEAVTFEANTQAAQAHPALGRRLARAQEDGFRVRPYIEVDPACVEEAVRRDWGEMASRYFSVRVDSRSDLALGPGAIIEVQSTLNADQNLPVFGRYVLVEVQHTLVRGAITTTAVGYRREAFEGAAAPTGATAASGASRDTYSLVGQQQYPDTVLVAEVLD